MVYETAIQFKDPDHGKSALILQCLQQLNVDTAQMVESRSGTATRISVYSDSRRVADILSKKIKDINLKGTKVSVCMLEDKDWKSKWTKDYKPFKITGDLRIVPYHRVKDCAINRGKDILIRTDVIFGSGQHETTKVMAEFICRRKGKIGSFLDIGTGTGILSVIAKKYGAGKIYSFDIDPEAVKNASFNFKTNKMKPDSLKVSNVEDYRVKNSFDFVAANLLTVDLIRMRNKIIKFVSPGGYLAVSGISMENYKEFRNRFDKECLRCVSIKKGREWTGVLYKRKG